jgi:hypothetical protein
MNLRMTHTFVTLGVPKAFFDFVKKQLTAASYGHAFAGDAIDMSGIGIVVDEELPPGEWHISTNSGVAVADNMEWQRMSSCPKGAKVQLLGPGVVSTTGTFNGGDTQWLGWAPIPAIPDWLKDQLNAVTERNLTKSESM